MSQHVDEGAYNDWDFGAHGVYGNLKLAKITDRRHFRIENAGPGTVTVRQINPSGIVVNTATVSFEGGLLIKLVQANQWGEQYEDKRFVPVGNDSFRVTDLVRGRNVILPCKYGLYIYGKELLREIQYYSFAGKLFEDRVGVAIIRYKRYDDPVRFGERLETAFFDAGGRPVFSKGTDYHCLKSKYDDQDNKVSDDFLGDQDEAVLVRRSGIAGERYSYDGDNNVIKVVNVDRDGKVVPNINGVAVSEFLFEQGYMMKQLRYDSLGNKTRALKSGDGISIARYEYDNAGNRVRESYYDTSEKPMNNNIGVQEVADFYSSASMLLKEAYFDEFGRPCVNRDGIHETHYGRDELGRAVEISNYGLNDRAHRTFSEQVYLVRKKYDAFGRVVCDSYWLDSSTRMASWNGAYQLASKFDGDGQPTEYAYLDAVGAPFKSADGSSVQKLVYDSAGNLAERWFLNKNKPVNRTTGTTMNFGILKYLSDGNGRTQELTFWDADNRGVNATIMLKEPISAHRIVFVYRGTRVVEQRYYRVDAAEPFLILDCLTNDYVNLNGISVGRKNAE